jgi:DNA polymerase kappa
MDAFYAAVEVKRDPSLKGKAFGVGGGVLTTASVGPKQRQAYLLMTVRGKKVRMPIWNGRVCGEEALSAPFDVSPSNEPSNDSVSNHFDLYISTSKEMREVLASYDPNLAMASLDEGYLKYVPRCDRADE